MLTFFGCAFINSQSIYSIINYTKNATAATFVFFYISYNRTYKK